MQQLAPGISGARRIRGPLTVFVALFALVLVSTPALAQQGPGGAACRAPTNVLLDSPSCSS